MQIISGRFRGKKLQWVSDGITRPTTARVKENIFNMLSSLVDFNGLNVLVLFAGSGQMGIECYSRGAKNIIFNDRSPEARKIIEKNCASVGLVPEISDLDFMQCLEKLKRRNTMFDIVFLDPPFADITAAPAAAGYLLENGMLTNNAVIVAETENPGLVFGGFDVRLKKYGRAQIYLLRKSQRQ